MAPSADAPFERRGVSRGLWLLLGGLLAAVLIPALLGGTGLYERLRTFPPGLLLVMIAMILVCWSLNALRLRLLLGRQTLGQRRALGIVVATEFAICATPAGAGGPITLAALLMRRGVAPARATAAFAVEHLGDLLFFCCALFGVLVYALTHALSAHVGNLLMVGALLLGAVLTMLVLLARYHRGLFRFNGRALRRLGVSRRKRYRWARRMLRFRNELGLTLSLPRRTLLAAFLLTSVHWLLRYSVLYLTLQGLGHDIAWAWTFLVQMLALTAGQLSLLPGGAGSAELASMALLAPLAGKSTTAAAILIWRFVTYYLYLIVGAPVFLHLAGRPLLDRLIRARQI